MRIMTNFGAIGWILTKICITCFYFSSDVMVLGGVWMIQCCDTVVVVAAANKGIN